MLLWPGRLYLGEEDEDEGDSGMSKEARLTEDARRREDRTCLLDTYSLPSFLPVHLIFTLQNTLTRRGVRPPPTYQPPHSFLGSSAHDHSPRNSTCSQQTPRTRASQDDNA